MKVLSGGKCVVFYEGLGFGLILVISALNNLFEWPRLLAGGENEVSRWRYGVMETAIILLTWAFVYSITRRLLQKVHRLEGMLRLCGWCRRIGHSDKWMSLEQYFAEGFQIETTHGICPDCRRRFDEDTRHFRLVEKRTGTPGRVVSDAPSA